MEGKRFLRTIRLDSILSFGPGTPELPLEPLNVLIGPNGAGKSNLIEALSLLAAAHRDIQEPIREGGGIREWPWKGVGGSPNATVDVTVGVQRAIRFRLSFTHMYGRFQLAEEAVESEEVLAGQTSPYTFYRYLHHGDPPVIDVATKGGERSLNRLQWSDVNPEQSILSQRQDPTAYPELTRLAIVSKLMSFHRDWHFGRRAPSRLPQQLDLPQGWLLEDASNLGVLLSYLLNKPPVKDELLSRLQDFYPAVDDVVPGVVGSTVQVFFHERGLREAVPATRLSDGSLRYLCLLAVLCNPESPWVICIEEPEIGLHPDVIPEVAKMLVEASSCSQIFVTTHSDILVDALTDVPEAVIVCEKPDAATQLRRLDRGDLRHWLDDYRLGELWTRGRFGGNRW
jgi:predicted ATPase